MTRDGCCATVADHEATRAQLKQAIKQPDAAAPFVVQECSVCLDRFSDPVQWRTFRCGHGLCAPCCERYITTTPPPKACLLCRSSLLDDGKHVDDPPNAAPRTTSTTSGSAVAPVCMEYAVDIPAEGERGVELQNVTVA